MELDELKQSWHEMKRELDRVETLNKVLTERLSRSKALPFKCRIMNQYKIIVAVSLCMIVFTSILFIDNLIFSRELSGSLVIYFIVLKSLNLYFMSRLRRIDIYTMPVAEMVEQTIKLRILRSRLKIIGYILMIPMMCVLLWTFYKADYGMFVGGWMGGVVGLIIGLRIDRSIDRDIKNMKAALKEELSESGGNEQVVMH